MRISDWSSDVCSSDLPATRKAYRRVRYRKPPISALHHAFRCSQPGERGKWCTACPVRQAHCRNTDDRPAVRRRRTSSSRSEEHTSELQSLIRISYAVFCLQKILRPPTLDEVVDTTQQ